MIRLVIVQSLCLFFYVTGSKIFYLETRNSLTLCMRLIFSNISRISISMCLILNILPNILNFYYKEAIILALSIILAVYNSRICFSSNLLRFDVHSHGLSAKRRKWAMPVLSGYSNSSFEERYKRQSAIHGQKHRSMIRAPHPRTAGRPNKTVVLFQRAIYLPPAPCNTNILSPLTMTRRRRVIVQIANRCWQRSNALFRNGEASGNLSHHGFIEERYWVANIPIISYSHRLKAYINDLLDICFW